MLASEADDDYHAVLWLDEALKRHELEQPSPTVEEWKILDHLGPTYHDQEQYEHAYHLTQRLLELNPNYSDAIYNLAIYEEKLKEKRESEAPKFEDLIANDMELPPVELKRRKISEHANAHYEALCRGEETKQVWCLF